MRSYFYIFLALLPTYIFSIPDTEEIVEKIKNTKLETDYFPYLVIDNFLPEDYYEEALQMFPSTGSIPSSSKRNVHYIDPKHP